MEFRFSSLLGGKFCLYTHPECKISWLSKIAKPHKHSWFKGILQGVAQQGNTWTLQLSILEQSSDGGVFFPCDQLIQDFNISEVALSHTDASEGRYFAGRLYKNFALVLAMNHNYEDIPLTDEALEEKRLRVFG